MNNKIKIRFKQKDEQLNNFLEKIKTFGEIYYNIYSFRQCPMNMKPNRKYIITGDNKNIFTKIGNTEWMGTICENSLDKSIEEYKWKIKILRTYNKDIMVGVANSDFDILTSSYNTCGWYLYCNDSTLYSGPPNNYIGLKTILSKVKSEIVIVMNTKKRTLKFIINDEDKGESYTNIPIDKPLFPAICLAHKEDSVEIIEL